MASRSFRAAKGLEIEVAAARATAPPMAPGPGGVKEVKARRGRLDKILHVE